MFAFQAKLRRDKGDTDGELIKETIHAKGVDIGAYTTDFENEFILLTDILAFIFEIIKPIKQPILQWLRRIGI